MRLMLQARPKETPEAHAYLFGLLDKDRGGSIQIMEWLDMGEILSVRLVAKPKLRDMAGAGAERSPSAWTRLRVRCQLFTSNRIWRGTVTGSIAVYVLLFCIYWKTQPTSVQTGLAIAQAVLLAHSL
eukprot:UC1_evm1s1534